MDCLKTRQDQDFINEYLEKGQETRNKKQDTNWYLANQEGNKNIKMHEIENIKIILLCSAEISWI